MGEIDEESDDSKCCTNKIQIVEEISWEDVLRMVNLGKGNAGLCNSGNYNSGDWNSGDWNSGDWNKTNFSNGCFNTQEPKILLFNKPSDWTYRDWLNSDARYILNQMPRNVVEWVYPSDMTEEEKKSYPSYETTGGYLKNLDEKDCSQIWWDGLSVDDKNIVMPFPNFNAEIFEKCTGISINIKNAKTI